MSIRIGARRPSTDGLGVKRWTYRLNDFVTLHVFWRPESVVRKPPYLLRVDHIDGHVLETRFANFESEATDKAKWIESRVHSGELK